MIWPFSLLHDLNVKLRLAGAEVNHRLDELAAPPRPGASDTQITADLNTLKDLTQTVKLQGTGTVRRKE